MYHSDPVWNELISLEPLDFSSMDLLGNLPWVSSIDKEKPHTQKTHNHDKQQGKKSTRKLYNRDTVCAI